MRTVISADELRALPEYTWTLPTGTTIGKRWRTDVSCLVRPTALCVPLPCLPPAWSPVAWKIGEYYDIGHPERVGIRWSWAVDERGRPHRGAIR